MRKIIAALALALGIIAVQALPALACGGLIAPDGDVRLQQATTLVAWHNGIEHYLTSFTYEGSSSKLGWIVPLPAVPLQIQDGGAWTLQRLEIESHPAPAFTFNGETAAAVPSATVLQRVKIEALNITVIKGSGPEVINWANSNGFTLEGDTASHLLTYAKGSQIFMAVKFDTSAAKARGQLEGDGTPILITMKTPHIWVPLEVLAIDGNPVQADLFLLTDNPVYTSDFDALVGQSSVGSTVANAQGFTLAFQERMNTTLYHDLSTDRNMGWVWPNSWLTYLTLNAPSNAVTYDLGVSSSGVIRLAPFGTPPAAVVDTPASHELPAWLPRLPLGTPQLLLGLVIVLAILASIILYVRHRRRAWMQVGV
jgi:hypothetical protein